MGVIALLLCAAFRMLWSDLGSQAETVMAVLGLIMVLSLGRGIRGGAALWLLLAVVVVQVISWTLGYFHHPQWVADNPQVDRLAKLFIFISIAWWLGGSTRNTLLIWCLAVVGLILSTVVQGGGLDEWLRGYHGHRVDFGIRNAQHTAMLFGTSFIGLAVFAPRFLAPGRWRGVRGISWGSMFLLSAVGVMFTQTRAVWLALALALPIMLCVWLVARRCLGDTPVNRKFLMAGLVMLLVIVGTASAFKGHLLHRLGAESTVIGTLLDGDIEDVPYSSIGIRIHSWQAALEWIEQRPLVGWGGEGRGLVMDHTDWLPDHIRNNFGHLHNFFLEVWVAYGLLGLAVIVWFAFWIGLATLRAWRDGVLPGDMALFGAGFFVYWMVVNQFESYNSFWTGVYVHNLVLGGLITHYWRWQRVDREPSRPPGADDARTS